MKTKKKTTKYRTKVTVPETDMDKEVREVIERLHQAIADLKDQPKKEDREEEVG